MNLKAVPKALLVTLLASSLPLSSVAYAAPNANESSLVQQQWEGNWPTQNEAEKLVQELYYQRAISAYYQMQPAMNVIGMRDGSESKFGKGYNVLPIWKDRMDSRTLVPTPNADVVYSMNYLDLKETGPLVVAAPPKVIGMFTDFFQRTITDVGLIGPDRARGGLYLLLPPNYDGPVPKGYLTFTSSTNNVFLFFRTVMKKGENGADPSDAVKIAEQTRIYPLWDEEKNIKPMAFPNASGQRINMMYPTDFSYWEKMKQFVDEEPISAISPELRGVLASIGIVKGKPFNPTVEEKQLLEKAVKTAPKMITAQRLLGRKDERNLYYKDRQYERAWAGATSEYMQESYLDIDQRAAFFQYAYSSAPAMVMRTMNAGSKYPFTVRDSKGDILNGSHQYKLHLPANPPAKLFWAVTLYNVVDGTMPETSQLLPSKNGFDNIEKNTDGSIDLYFGPQLPNGAPESNYIKTIPGRDFLTAIRLYGTGIEFFDQTWKPDDVLKIK
ncbi:TPA: DUF1254 domain-containing protein [Vibrio parahaemolyticus]|nr:DUF1254 domain-containing protein [Vibrio parahaemolyticus]HCG6544105.1 DUF1254 domain-containing protein [Vibrio parahaemolyticus]